MTNLKQIPTDVAEFKYEINHKTDTITILKFVGMSMDVIIPDQIEGRPIRTIFIEAFAESKVRSVRIPEGVVELNRYAFYKCPELTSVHLPESMEVIGARAFAWCRNLQQINLPHRIQEIYEGAFEGCQQMAITELPQALVLLDESAFRECYALAEIMIPDGVEEIMAEAFRDCIHLRKVTIPARTRLIEFSVFEGCSELAEIDIANPAIDIEPGAFRGTRLLTAPNQCLGARQVDDWTILCDTIVIDHLRQGHTMIVPDGITSLNGCLCGTESITETVMLPESLLVIGTRAFVGCRNLKHLVLPPHLQKIGEMAFDECEKLHIITMTDDQVETFKYDFSETAWYKERFGK